MAAVLNDPPSDQARNSQEIHLHRQRLAMALKGMLPPSALLTAAEDLRPYECDGLAVYRQLPMLAVLPSSVAEVEGIMRVANANDAKVVARGSGTGLSGGATPLADGILLSLSKFSRIVSVDALARTALVEPGVRNLRISETVAPLSLYYAPDPSSQIACSIGGNVAENAGGVHCLKYGLTVHNILKLNIVTVDGISVTVGSDALDSPGYDLLALMTGSEGMLGITTEVTVKLTPKPQLARVVMASFDDVEKAGEAVAGFGKVEEMLGKGRARVLVHAAEATADGCRKLDRMAAPEVEKIGLFQVDELDLAFGRSNVIHAAVAKGGLAEKLLAAVRRIEIYDAQPGATIFEERA